MDRKKIIINEIKYWKKCRLLPDHYCNFLLSLYTEGDQPEEINEKQTMRPFKLMPFLMTIFVLALFGLTFLVIYFTDFSSFLQTAVVIFLSIIILLLSIQMKHYDSRLVHLYILIAALMIFIATIHVTNAFFPEQPEAILGAVMLTCFIWLVIGKKYNLKYFLLSGALGIIIAIYFFLR
ncbi:hypothetical protein DS745_14395 [Anaerobacillus alkaliphilus]|uniref:DUF2157 domain-containing protein n=1 Tax=Anaerobacillus alkaliphilus TaxID=1548597 RepID=A0A4Q0VQK0_9BACI|nr:hypothetical protein [Anaerobacillus alkaliphilus]RXI99416.1 hypothetical protein DS745_14395 [Anaerobacillus alkaliphilus]